MSDTNNYHLQEIHRITAIAPDQWNRCANPPNADGSSLGYDPFVSYEFLSALEQSGSVTPETGWSPHHLAVVDRAGEICGVLPLYLKSHSYGEFVFDFGWAEAFAKAGGAYYPKLQVAVPFTPVTGRRILVYPHPEAEEIGERLLAGAIALLRRYHASSLHLTFLDRVTWEQLGRQGFLLRTDQQFHWSNAGYRSLSEFLAGLSSKRRRVILRERKLALQGGIQIEHLTGRAIQESHWDHFFSFYQDTGSRKWGTPYLTREFFSRIGESMADRILLILCKRDGEYLAGALNFIGSDALFGRYWGCLEECPFLHFEVCYYQAIDYAIEHRLSTVEAGAQGEHKLARGYLPQYTYSAHWIGDPGFREAVSRYLATERGRVTQEVEILSRHTPFHR